MKIKRKRKYKPPLATGNETSLEVMRSHFDPNGSYTGIPTDLEDNNVPVQDSDDL